jgi:RimJ/RimL family protein N-acetyltransferase
MSGSCFSSSGFEVPVLETERLRLRGHRLDDFVYCAAMWADAEVTRFIGGKPLSDEEAWTKFLRYAGHWSLLGFGYWAAEEKATGKFAGEIGFADFKREIEPSLRGVPEIGWVLASAFHGKGYATEAVRAVVEWGDRYFIKRHLEQPHAEQGRTACIIAPDNLASIRVAEKCGYGQSQLTTYRGHAVLMFVREAKPSL